MKKYLKDLSHSASLKDRVYGLLKEEIVNGHIKPGEHLNELELSKAMNISRGPIREALNILEKEGFATIIPRKGAVVASVTVEDVKNIWEMRRLLEPYSAQISVDRITEQELDMLESKLQNVQENPEDFDAYMDADLELHELLHKYIENVLLRDNLVMVKQHSLRARYFAEGNAPMRKDVILVATKEHKDIINNLKKRDSKGVFESVKLHLMNAERRTLEALRKHLQ